MSSLHNASHTQVSSTGNKSKRRKRKNNAEKNKPNGKLEVGVPGEPNEEHVHEDDEGDEPETPIEPEHPSPATDEPLQNGITTAETTAALGSGSDRETATVKDDPASESAVEPELSNGTSGTRSRKATLTNQNLPERPASHIDQDTEARLEALAKERAALREEVIQLRQSLEEIQGKHEEELRSANDQLEEVQGEKEHIETQYQSLRGKVGQIQSNLKERLRADAEELSHARNQIEELEEQNGNLQAQNSSREAELAKLADEGDERSKELSSLRNRMNLSQQNWTKEREDLTQRESYAREEFVAAKQAMSEWEVLAMEERSIRENLADTAADLEEQLAAQREAHEKAAAERDSQSLTVDGLQRALQDIQDARKRELREMVENSQSQIEELRKQVRQSHDAAAEASTALDSARKEIERALPFEMEVKEKNLLIGKLRHEAVILNDHLTKALRYLRKGKPEDNIDKQLVTNHFLQFLALDRSDPKKFQILQIISALLGWNEEQRESAGLARPGASNPSLRAPISPWHRTPSTPSLSSEAFRDGPGGGRKESLAGLWSEFLEQEAREGAASSSRSTSVSGATNKAS